MLGKSVEHARGGLAGGDDVTWNAGTVRARERSGDEVARVGGVDAGPEDVLEILTEVRERSAQCSCLGSDQADSPVTALNLRRRPAISCSALSELQRVSS